MKIAVITDIHHGPLSHTKLEGWQGLPVLERFLGWAEEQGADLVLDLGDHISDVDATSDARTMAEVVRVFETSAVPRVHVLGNHDVANLSVAQNEDIFGMSLASRVVDLGELRLIAWQPDVRIERGVGFAPTGEHLDWLVAALEADERPAIIATHVPLSGHSQIGNYYFEGHPHYATYPDHARVRQAVEGTGRAAAWLSGHVHWNTLTTIAGIRHFTLQSMSERFTTMPEPAAAYALVEITDGEMAVTVYGEDRFHARVPFRASGERPWMAPRRAHGEELEAERA